MTFNLRLALVVFCFLLWPYKLTKHKIKVKLDLSLANIDFTNEPLNAVEVSKNRLVTRFFPLTGSHFLLGFKLSHIVSRELQKDFWIWVELIWVKCCLICSSIDLLVQQHYWFSFFPNTIVFFQAFVLPMHTEKHYSTLFGCLLNSDGGAVSLIYRKNIAKMNASLRQ